MRPAILITTLTLTLATAACSASQPQSGSNAAIAQGGEATTTSQSTGISAAACEQTGIEFATVAGAGVMTDDAEMTAQANEFVDRAIATCTDPTVFYDNAVYTLFNIMDQAFENGYPTESSNVRSFIIGFCSDTPVEFLTGSTGNANVEADGAAGTICEAATS